MTHSKAIASETYKQFRDELKKHGVKLLCGGLDESPFAYKEINHCNDFEIGKLDKPAGK